LAIAEEGTGLIAMDLQNTFVFRKNATAKNVSPALSLAGVSLSAEVEQRYFALPPR
jgi:hypothetical protein